MNWLKPVKNRAKPPVTANKRLADSNLSASAFRGVLLSSPTPASVPVAPIASEVAESRRAQPAPPAVAAAPVNERRTVPQKDTDAPAAQFAADGGKKSKRLPLL